MHIGQHVKGKERSKHGHGHNHQSPPPQAARRQTGIGTNQTGKHENLEHNPDATSASITVSPGNQWFDAVVYGPDVSLGPGRYYRLAFDVSVVDAPEGDFAATVRAGIASSKFCFAADKQLSGGGMLARFEETPRPFELWFQAPLEDSRTPGQTEPMRLRFESWLYDSNTGFPFYKDVSGTVRCNQVFAESFAAQ